MAALLLILCQHTLEDVKMGKRNWEAYNVTYEAYFKFFRYIHQEIVKEHLEIPNV